MREMYVKGTHLIFLIVYFFLALWGILGLIGITREEPRYFFISLVVIGGIFTIIWSLLIGKGILFWWLDRAVNNAIYHLGADKTPG